MMEPEVIWGYKCKEEEEEEEEEEEGEQGAKPQ